MGAIVEIFGSDDERHFIACLGQEEQAADNGPFGLDAAGRLAIKQFADAVGLRIARLFFYRGHRSIRLLKKSGRGGEWEGGRHAGNALPLDLPLSPSIFPHALSVATVGTTHTLSSPSTSLE